MDNLLSQPHQADESAECASDHKTTLEAVCKQILSAKEEDMKHWGSYNVFYRKFTHDFMLGTQERGCDGQKALLEMISL